MEDQRLLRTEKVQFSFLQINSRLGFLLFNFLYLSPIRATLSSCLSPNSVHWMSRTYYFRKPTGGSRHTSGIARKSQDKIKRGVRLPPSLSPSLTPQTLSFWHCSRSYQNNGPTAVSWKYNGTKNSKHQNTHFSSALHFALPPLYMSLFLFPFFGLRIKTFSSVLYYSPRRRIKWGQIRKGQNDSTGHKKRPKPPSIQLTLFLPSTQPQPCLPLPHLPTSPT